MDHLLAREPQRGFFKRVAVDDARFLVAVQVEPAAHVVGLDEFLRHGRVADQGLHRADHALARDARLEEDVVQVELELLGPVPRRDLDAHGLGEVVDAEHHVLHRRVLHEVGRDLERLRVLDDGLDGDAVVEAHEHRREVADLGRSVGFARLRQHDDVEVVGEIAHERQVGLVLLGPERVDADAHLQALAPRKARELAPQELAAHLLLPAAVLEIEEEGVRGGMPGMLAETLRGAFQVFVQPERGRVLDRGVIDLDSGPVIAQHRGRRRGLRRRGQRGGGEGAHRGQAYAINRRISRGETPCPPSSRCRTNLARSHRRKRS
jgi:hypothetical protein